MIGQFNSIERYISNTLTRKIIINEYYPTINKNFKLVFET